MTRSIRLELNLFPTIPAGLEDPGDPTNKTPLKAVAFEVKTLLHHAFIAKYGEGHEDSGSYEYERFITSGPDWRFLGSGIGKGEEAKRNVSNELGKGFARWFHYTYLRHTYFCLFEDVLERTNADGSRWTRKVAGDLPDYVCGRDKADINLLEAKGRYRALTFKGFKDFRQQIARAQLLDGQGAAIQVKGFISVACWAVANSPPSAKLLVEDPMTEGRPAGDDGYPAAIGLSMVAGHYAPILSRLQLPAHVAAIRTLKPVAESTGARRGIWTCHSGALKGRRFVGGILPSRNGASSWPWLDWEAFYDMRPSRIHQGVAPWVLSPPARFFGVEESVFRRVLSVTRRGLDAAADIEPVPVPEATGSLSLLRDGTVLGPLTYFQPADILDL